MSVEVKRLCQKKIDEVLPRFAQLNNSLSHITQQISELLLPWEKYKIYLFYYLTLCATNATDIFF
jgi:hypothetical protein